MSKKNNSNDWNNWKPGSGQIKGGQHRLDIVGTAKQPPVRDSHGYPVKDGKTDWAAAIREANERHGQ